MVGFAPFALLWLAIPTLLAWSDRVVGKPTWLAGWLGLLFLLKQNLLVAKILVAILFSYTLVTYQTNLPTTNWNWNNIICKKCRKTSLKTMLATNELCCERCGVLETLDGAYFDDEELHKCGDDYKIIKPRRTNRKYNFRRYIESQRKIIITNGHILSFETIGKANEIFERIEEHLPKRISLPFVAYQILGHVVQSAEEKYVLNYFWLQVPQKAVAKQIGKWNDMLQKLQDAKEA